MPLGARISEMRLKLQSCIGRDRMLVRRAASLRESSGLRQQIRSIATDWLDEGIGKIIQASRILNVLCVSLLGLLIILVAMSVGSIQGNIIHGMGM